MKHLADHRKPTTGARLREFFRLARDRGETVWARLHQRPQSRTANRRMVEFARIERGRDV